MTPIKQQGLSGAEAFTAFREYALTRGIEPTEVNLKGWDLAHNHQGIRRSFGASDAELLEQAVLLNYRRFL